MISYIISSSLFTISSIIYFVGAVYILNNTLDNISSLLANLFYVFGYSMYMFECYYENKNMKRKETYIDLDDVNDIEKCLEKTENTKEKNKINKKLKSCLEFYLFSNSFFMTSSIIYLISSSFDFNKSKATGDAIQLVGNLLYMLAYFIYIVECKIESKKKDNFIDPFHKPFLRRRIE